MFDFPFWSRNKGGNARPPLSDESGLLVQHLAPKWYHLAKQGMVFSGSAASAGIVLPIYSGTGQVFGIWNPAGSGVNVVLINVSMGYVDTTGAAGSYVWGINKNIGSALATGGISAFTAGTPDKGIVGSGSQGGSRVLFTPSGATTIAPVIWRHIGWNQTVVTAADNTNIISDVSRDYDGEACIGPGNAIWLSGNIATLSKWVPTVTWAELPV